MNKRKLKPGAAARSRYEERKVSLDLPDNLHDEERMESEEATINLPDVADIPGQEHIRPMPLGDLADTTISSDDEEGYNVFQDKPRADPEEPTKRGL